MLDYSLDNTNPKINPNGLLTMNGGTLTVNGNASANTSATVNGLTLGAGAEVIEVNNGSLAYSATLNLGTITRSTSGGSVRFNLPANGAITSTKANTNGILGGWATITDSSGVTGFAANNGSNNIVRFESSVKNDVTTWAANENVTDSTTGYTGTIYGIASTPNSIIFNSSGASTITIDNNSLLTIGSGGVLMTNAAGGTATITGGTLASGTGNELIFTADHSDESARDRLQHRGQLDCDEVRGRHACSFG